MTIYQTSSPPRVTIVSGSLEGPTGNASETTATTTTTTTSAQYPLYSLAIEGCVYRGEGNANLVVALPSERKVIRLRKSSSSSSSSSSSKGNSLQEEEAQIRREVDFIRRVISGHLGAYVRVPEILRCDYPEIARLSDAIRQSRPEHRRSKDIVGVYATKYPDYTYLPYELQSNPSMPTFCVEIKPKQAYLCQTDRIFQKCPYCLTQYYKKQTGSIREPSDYCPFDLFSGDTSRTEGAIDALLRSPQNNLKIFKNGETIYDEVTACKDESSLKRVLNEELKLQSNELLRLLRCALERPFDGGGTAVAERKREDVGDETIPLMLVPKRLDAQLVGRTKTLLSMAHEACDMSSKEEQQLAVGSVLERILRMQKLHRRGADVVTWIHASLGTTLRDCAVYEELRDATDVEGLSEYAVQDKALNRSLEKDVFKYFTLEQCYEIMRNYLLFCTAKDCSVLIAFQRIDKDSTIHQNSIHRIDISENQSFLVSVRILDLDMKKLQCIEKHRRRDNNVLQATIKELEKQLGLSDGN